MYCDRISSCCLLHDGFYRVILECRDNIQLEKEIDFNFLYSMNNNSSNLEKSTTEHNYNNIPLH